MNHISLPGPNASLDELLEAARARYDVAFEPVKIGDTTLDVLQIQDMESYIEKLAAELPPGSSLELPFWAKIWRTSFLLAFYVQRLPKGASLLEIGAGVGVCGLFAAARGLRCVITDIHPDAVLFTRINIMQNGLADLAEARKVDFTTYRLEESFDFLIGSEVLYRDEHYRPLTKFLLAHLRNGPGAEAVLAREYTRKAEKFFKLAGREFEIDTTTIGFKQDDEEQPDEKDKHLAAIHRLRARKNA